jgi:uncharacterized Fe-S cluster-containing radical SAM superfamily enzyme
MAHTAMDRLKRTAGDVVNGHLSAMGEPSRYPRARLIVG